jgi:hypothetical protein
MYICIYNVCIYNVCIYVCLFQRKLMNLKGQGHVLIISWWNRDIWLRGGNGSCQCQIIAKQDND